MGKTYKDEANHGHKVERQRRLDSNRKQKKILFRVLDGDRSSDRIGEVRDN
jgi:hypothetical protein